MNRKTKSFISSYGCYRLQKPSKDSSPYYWGHGCKNVTRVLYPLEMIDRCIRIFDIDISNAGDLYTSEFERSAMRATISILEKYAATITGTLNDYPSIGWNPDGQLDCVDEAANTFGMLLLLQNNGLIQQHELVGPRSKFRWRTFWQPHYAVQIRARNGVTWAVDSGVSRPGGPIDIVKWGDFYK